jgi:NHL repeat
VRAQSLKGLHYGVMSRTEGKKVRTRRGSRVSKGKFWIFGEDVRDDALRSAGRFSRPWGVAADSADNIYVADSNSTMQKMTPVGTNWVVTTPAGVAGNAGTVDETGSAAPFGLDSEDLSIGPAGMAVDSSGYIYLADNTSRKGYPALVISSPSPKLGFIGGHFGFDLTGGPARKSVVVGALTDLVSRLPLWTNTLADPLKLSDPQNGSHSNRVYRARLP